MRVTHEGFSFKVQLDRQPESLTSHAGIPLVIEFARALGVTGVIGERLTPPRHPNGYPHQEVFESFLAAIPAGAKNIEDVAFLGTDRGLMRLLDRRRWPSADTLGRFLEAAHELPGWQAGSLGAPLVPVESARLKVLAEANRVLVGALQRRRGWSTATIDHDATIIESSRREALFHYDGGRGYQPWIAYWREAGLVVADEFREGNVPAGMAPLAQVKAAFAGLPEGITKRYFRADTAMYNHEAMDWLDAEKIGFAISADMTSQFRTACEGTPESRWTRLRKFTEHGPIPTDYEIADIDFQPFGERYLSKRMRTSRYIAIRKRDEQGRLFRKDEVTWYHGLVTNRFDEPADQLWWWHREKCGTVERVHDELKNDLAAGVMPCGRVQANAAWFRLNVIVYNLLSAIKTLGLPKEMAAHRPATLRYRLLNLAGRVVLRSRQLILRLPWISGFVDLYRRCRTSAFHRQCQRAPARA